MIVFDPISHSYKNEFTGEVYISATTLIHKYKKPFDAKLMSERVAKKEGVTPEEIQSRWKVENNKSKDYGTELHAVIEDYLKTGNVSSDYTDFVQAYIDLGVVTRKDELLVEHKMYSHEYKVAGTADIIRLEKNGGFSVFDLKTNKKFNYYNQYNEYLLSPLQHLTASEYSIYGIQLSLYAYMYQNHTGRRVNSIGVTYYDRNTNAFTYHPMSYMKYEVKALLDHFKDNEIR
jgi:PD-(D/E)XK nuclease superfamily